LLLQVREISEVINSGIQPIQNLSVMNRVSEEPAKRVEWSKYWIEKGLGGKRHTVEIDAAQFFNISTHV
jgi:hypothetical protein